MSAAAQRDTTIDHENGFPSVADSNAAALKQLAAERLAAHRTRRARTEAEAAEMQARIELRREGALTASKRGASRVREAVAARYQTSPSYREFLAAEAERALQQAQAEAEIATRNARAVAEAQMQLMDELEQYAEREPGPREQVLAAHQSEVRGELAHALADIVLGAKELIAEPPLLTIVEAAPKSTSKPRTSAAPASPAHNTAAITEVSTGGLKVRLFDDLGPARSAAPPRSLTPDHSQEQTSELAHLEQEIEFRFAPEFEDHIIETLPIHGNLIEFPRELVAPRRARPRIAEGPLRDESPAEPQLRIFEVEAEQIATDPLPTTEASGPEWQSLHLSSVVREPHAPTHPQVQFTADAQAASLNRRAMSITVDACCLGFALLGFVTVATRAAGTPLPSLPLPVLAGTLGATLLTLFLGYHLLFFTFGEATPGMRVARLGLCTFGDSNPTRKAMRRRLLATLLAATPLGLGLLWAVLDGDRLAWHDRLSRMYLRSY